MTQNDAETLQEVNDVRSQEISYYIGGPGQVLGLIFKADQMS